MTLASTDPTPNRGSVYIAKEDRIEMRKRFAIIALTLFFYILMTPAFGINVGFSSEKNGEIASSSAGYDLDQSTTLVESATLGDGRE